MGFSNSHPQIARKTQLGKISMLHNFNPQHTYYVAKMPQIFPADFVLALYHTEICDDFTAQFTAKPHVSNVDFAVESLWICQEICDG